MLTVFKGYLYLTSIELLLVLIALTQSSSMERNAILWGYSIGRLSLIGITSVCFLMFGYLSWTITFHYEKFQRLISTLYRINSRPNVKLVIRDSLIVGCIGLLLLLFFRSYSPKFLGFIWPPLTAVIDRSLPLLFMVVLFNIQSLLLQWGLEIFPGGYDLIKARRKIIKLFFLLTFIIFLFGVYQWSAKLTGAIPGVAYFPELAEAFLDGNLYLEKPRATKDLSFYGGKYYVSFPPLGAFLMLPTVARYTKFGVNTITFSNVVAALGVTATFLMVESLSRRKWVSLKSHESVILAIAIGFGTAMYYMSTTGAVWHISQILTFLFLTLALWITLSNQSSISWANYRTAFLSGMALSLAMLARPHVVIAWLLIMGITYQHFQELDILSWKRLLVWASISLSPILVVSLWLLWYNWVRFGSALNFGYEYMLVGPTLAEPLRTYGQFHPHFIWQNLKANWLGLPYWHTRCQRLIPSREGMSLLITSPVLLYTVYSLKQRTPWLRGAWLSVIGIASIHLFYFNTGGHQFGYRFSVDFMPVMACLLAVGLQRRFSWLPLLLIIYSVGINYIGVLWNAKQFCDTW